MERRYSCVVECVSGYHTIDVFDTDFLKDRCLAIEMALRHGGHHTWMTLMVY